MTTPERLAIEALEKLRRKHFVLEEDCWYSCPASGECCNDNSSGKCNCGAYEDNAIIDQAIASLRADKDDALGDRSEDRAPGHPTLPLPNPQAPAEGQLSPVPVAEHPQGQRWIPVSELKEGSRYFVLCENGYGIAAQWDGRRWVWKEPRERPDEDIERSMAIGPSQLFMPIPPRA